VAVSGHRTGRANAPCAPKIAALAGECGLFATHRISTFFPTEGDDDDEALEDDLDL
jgi:hypothetical protein